MRHQHICLVWWLNGDLVLVADVQWNVCILSKVVKKKSKLPSFKYYSTMYWSKKRRKTNRESWVSIHQNYVNTQIIIIWKYLSTIRNLQTNSSSSLLKLLVYKKDSKVHLNFWSYSSKYGSPLAIGINNSFTNFEIAKSRKLISKYHAG